MDFLFGSRKTPQEILKQNQRALQRSQRDLDRERTKLEQQEKKLVADIKKSAKLNQMGALRIMARDLVRTRRYIQKMHETRTQLQQISLQIQTFSSNQQMADSIKGVTMAMKSMNRGYFNLIGVNLPQIQQIMDQFQKESTTMEMKQEIMDDTVDEAMGDYDDEEETDLIVDQVLDEIGINLKEQMASAPTANVGLVSAVQDDQLQQRLDSLRRE